MPENLTLGMDKRAQDLIGPQRQHSEQRYVSDSYFDE